MPYTVSLEYCRFGKYSIDEATLVVEAPSSILAAEKAERVAADTFGGDLDWWFAYKVEPDTSIEEICNAT